MPISLPGVPFKLTAEDMGGFNAPQAFSQGQGLISNFINQRGGLAQAIGRELENQMQAPRSRMAEPFAQAALQLAQAQPGSMNASTAYTQTNTALNNLKLKYPGLGQGGIVGELAYAQLLKDDPRMAQQVAPVVRGGSMGYNQQQPVVQPQPPQMGGSEIPQVQGEEQPSQEPDSIDRAAQLKNQRLASVGKPQFNYGQNPQQHPGQLNQGLQNTMMGNQNDPLSLLMQNINADINNKQAMAEYRRSGGFGGGAGVKELNAISRQLQAEYPYFTPEQIIDARNAVLEGRDTLSDGNTLKPISGTLRSLLDQNYKRGTDVAQRNQERFANTLETTFKEGDKVAPGAFKFAGAAGKIKGGIDALKVQKGVNDPDYKDYLTFTRQVLPAMASEILRTGGANSTDSQKAMAIQQANPINWDTNPELAMQQYEFLKSLYRKIGKTVASGPAATHQALSGGGNESSGNKETNWKRVNGQLVRDE